MDVKIVDNVIKAIPAISIVGGSVYGFLRLILMNYYTKDQVDAKFDKLDCKYADAKVCDDRHLNDKRI